MKLLATILAAACLIGCAEGYQATGAGLEAGQAAFEAGEDEIGQAGAIVGSVSPFLPPPWNTIAIAAGVLLPLFRKESSE